MSLVYVIDGYNLIRHPLFNRRFRPLKEPRRQLFLLISKHRLTGSPKNKTVIVFDGYPPDGFEQNPSVVFSRGISADEKIRRLVEKSARRADIIVVSDDREVKFNARACGAKFLLVEDFLGAKKAVPRKKEPLKPELTYSQVYKINEELSRLWLKKHD